MRRHLICATVLLPLVAPTLLSTPVTAQTPVTHSGFGTANYLILPQSRAFAFRPRSQPVRIERVTATIKILEQTARTTLQINLRNPSSRMEEAVLLLPVPRQAAVSGFSFQGNAAEPTARLLSKEEARRTYDQIVRKLRDPALLEFAGFNLIRSSVFPVPAGGTQRIRLTYEHVLEADGARVDYVLPRSESLDNSAPWHITAEITAEQSISMVYSPSHLLDIRRISKRKMSVAIKASNSREPGSFRLSYLLANKTGISAALFAYPDPKIGGGYFLLLAGLPPELESKQRMKREVTIVLDRSGSMAGGKMDQARAAALQVIEGLEDGEGFNVIDYATTVESFAPKPVVKSNKTIQAVRTYLANLRPNGGTNIHDAIVEALGAKPLEGALPIILFMTDGLPTVGRTNEKSIRDLVEKGNSHHRRLFSFGVGHDVNVALLDSLADLSRATATYVLPKEDVEVKVAKVFRKLQGPVLASPVLTTLDSADKPTTRRVRELQPQSLGDMFDRDQLVVLGQYRGTDPLRFRLDGNYFGEPRSFAFKFPLDRATTRNAFVPRLWATRQIAYLVEQIRRAGATQGNFPAVVGKSPFDNPRLRELRDEIMRLSTEFGVLSEYTSFLATEGTRLDDWQRLTLHCQTNLDTKAMKTRSGKAAVSFSTNYWFRKGQTTLNFGNGQLDENLNTITFSRVRQVCDRTFFRRGAEWVDGRLLRKAEFKAAREVRIGTPEHFALLRKLIPYGRQSALSLKGNILIKIDDEVIRVINN